MKFYKPEFCRPSDIHNLFAGALLIGRIEGRWCHLVVYDVNKKDGILTVRAILPELYKEFIEATRGTADVNLRYFTENRYFIQNPNFPHVAKKFHICKCEYEFDLKLNPLKHDCPSHIIIYFASKFKISENSMLMIIDGGVWREANHDDVVKFSVHGLY